MEPKFDYIQQKQVSVVRFAMNSLSSSTCKQILLNCSSFPFFHSLQITNCELFYYSDSSFLQSIEEHPWTHTLDSPEWILVQQILHTIRKSIPSTSHEYSYICVYPMVMLKNTERNSNRVLFVDIYEVAEQIRKYYISKDRFMAYIIVGSLVCLATAAIILLKRI